VTPPWFKHTVIYALDVETFADSDGDGACWDAETRRVELDGYGFGWFWHGPAGEDRS
jgi:hypothetical protein